MDVLKRINEIMEKQELTDYQLSKISGLSSSTISNMRQRNTVPSVPTLELICNALHITLSQFFVDEDTQFFPVTPLQREMINEFIFLSKQQQQIIVDLLKSMNHSSAEPAAEEEGKTDDPV